ncbi:hypothetical protein M724_01455 [Neisseria gonorrhoeae ATL_2011_01_05]|nr:hypothetical protein M724_01455 [Neisseria gonorrhoeae ATL_2011_01_05]
MVIRRLHRHRFHHLTETFCPAGQILPDENNCFPGKRLKPVWLPVEK